MPSEPETLAEEFNDQSFYMPTSKAEVIKVALLGLVIGIVIPVISFLLERFFIEPVFCRSADSFGVCSSGGVTAYYIATGLVSLLAIVLLVNWQVFRPLLIVVGAAAALWGFMRYVGDLASHSLLEYYLFSALVFAATYLLFYWIMRVRVFMLSLLLALALVVAVRLALIT